MLDTVLTEDAPPSGSLTLSFDRRQKSRQRARLDSGEEVAIRLPRGTILQAGDRLGNRDGLVVEVRAAAEAVSTASTDDMHLLARACYHLGNRHLPLQIGDGWVRYAHDHVIDDMVAGLGLKLEHHRAPFEPESGAYRGHVAHHH